MKKKTKDFFSEFDYIDQKVKNKITKNSYSLLITAK